MRYLYKINSQYDGFTPQRIPDRMEPGQIVKLGWAKYLDVLSVRDEVWVVFVGGRFAPGVYLQGLVKSINRETGMVDLRVREYSTAAPLTDPITSQVLRDIVSTRYRQVFLWPPEWKVQEQCHVADCGNRQCSQCDVWNSIPQIEPRHYQPPPPLRGLSVVPAYWIVPTRCYLYYGGRPPAPWVSRITNMFSAFKVGEKRYAFPLAAGIHEALKSRGEADFDAIVPIPLSPEKAAAGELDRTGLLSAELTRMTGTRTRSYLSLSAPISKRRMQQQGYRPWQFQARYRQLLQVDPKLMELQRVLLLDDVITYGSTTAVAVAAMKALNSQLEVVVAAAGQMIVKAVVTDDNGPAW